MYDLGIIGGGPGGYVAAERAGHNGLKTVLFEAKDLGGVCLNEGCIPTKTLLYSAKIYDSAKKGESFGVLTEGLKFDFSKMMARKNKVVKKLVMGVGGKMKKHKVEVINALAQIESRGKDFIEISADGKSFQCKNILICTGSEAAIPPIPGLDKQVILTNREILQMKSVPKELVIIGGGVIGTEFAGLFNSLGSKITVIEMMDEILPGMDREISAMLRTEMQKKGVEFNLNCKVTELKGKEVIYEKDGKKVSVKGDEVLMSVGRTATIKGFGMEKLGVETFRGGIKIDKNCRTNIPNVYAAGDVTGFSQLAHTASREGEVAVNHILGIKDTMRYNAIPGVVYTNPEVSGVGLTEDAAREKGVEYEVRSLPMVYAGRFLAENDNFSGYCKVLVGKKYKEILGVHMIGNPSSEMIYGASIAIESELTVKEMQSVVFPHPTVSEIFKETIFEF